MICKKVPNKGGSSKAARVAGLADYIISPELSNGQEKCIAHGAENFITDTHAGHVAEMVSLAQETVHSKNPVDHWVMSWRSDEHPTPEQAKQAVEIFIKQAGLEGHQYIWGLHVDTENKHVHIEVNRVNPDTLKVVSINKGFDREASQQAIALIEHTQGWQSEKGSRYVIEDGKPVMTQKAKSIKTDRKLGTEPIKVATHAADMEVQTGTKSEQRIGIEQAAPIIQQAKSWKELHASLAAVGIEYRREGSGAKIYVDENAVGVKASDVHRSASFGRLQKRLGAYQPANQDIVVIKRSAEPQPLKPNQAGWKEYIVIHDAYKTSKAQSKLAMDKQQSAERNQLYAKLKIERTDVLSGDWKGKGELRNGLVSVLATAQMAEKLELQERHRAERQQFLSQYKAMPQYKEWLTRPAIVGTLIIDERAIVNRVKAPSLSSILKSLTYEKKNGHVTYRSKGADLFIDEGRRLQVVNENSETAIAAALAVAKQKFGTTLTLTGSSEFQRHAVEVAVKNNLGIKFADPSLETYRQSLMEKQNALSHTNQLAGQAPPPHLRNGLHYLSSRDLVLNLGGDELPLQQNVQTDVVKAGESQHPDLQRAAGRTGRVGGTGSTRDTRTDDLPSTSTSTRLDQAIVWPGGTRERTDGNLTENPSERSGLHADTEVAALKPDKIRSNRPEIADRIKAHLAKEFAEKYSDLPEATPGQEEVGTLVTYAGNKALLHLGRNVHVVKTYHEGQSAKKEFRKEKAAQQAEKDKGKGGQGG